MNILTWYQQNSDIIHIGRKEKDLMIENNEFVIKSVVCLALLCDAKKHIRSNKQTNKRKSCAKNADSVNICSLYYYFIYWIRNSLESLQPSFLSNAFCSHSNQWERRRRKKEKKNREILFRFDNTWLSSIMSPISNFFR